MEEQIERAKARIKELEILVKHWEKQKPLESLLSKGSCEHLIPLSDV